MKWKPHERQAIDELVRENNLYGNEDEVEMWINALMGEGHTFEAALDQAALLFSE